MDMKGAPYLLCDPRKKKILLCLMEVNYRISCSQNSICITTALRSQAQHRLFSFANRSTKGLIQCDLATKVSHIGPLDNLTGQKRTK